MRWSAKAQSSSFGMAIATVTNYQSTLKDI